MPRCLGLKTDAVVGGTSYDDLTAGAFPASLTADMFYPVTTAQTDLGLTQVNRDDEVKGRRGNSQPEAFASAPSLTFGARAYPELLRTLLRSALGGAVASTGTAPAAVSSTVSPLVSGELPAFAATLVREGQVDRLTGLILSELGIDLPVDGEGTLEATMQGLYHDVDAAAGITPALPDPTYAATLDDVFTLRDATATIGDGAGVVIDCLAGFGMTFSNGMLDDLRSRFCAGKNIERTTVDGRLHRLWYPERHKLGPQTITGRLDFGDVRPDRELRRKLTHGEKLVVDLTGGPISPATTPPADEVLRLTFYRQVPTGGGPDPLQRDGDQFSSYEFTAYVENVEAKDLDATFVGASALT